jgi:hypothetical protein
MQYENFLNPIWFTNDNDPRFMPINPVVFASSSVLELEPESMHPKTVAGRVNDPNRKVSNARWPSTEEASA